MHIVRHLFFNSNILNMEIVLNHLGRAKRFINSLVPYFVIILKAIALTIITAGAGSLIVAIIFNLVDTNLL